MMGCKIFILNMLKKQVIKLKPSRKLKILGQEKTLGLKDIIMIIRTQWEAFHIPKKRSKELDDVSEENIQNKEDQIKSSK